MSEKIDLIYPKPEDVVSAQFPDNPFPVKISTTNLVVGMSNLYKVLFLHIVVITIMLIPLHALAQQLAKSMTFYFIYRPLDIRYDILPSLTFEYLVSWLPMIYLFVKTKQYHEKNWKSTLLYETNWDLFDDDVGGSIIKDLAHKYRYIFLIIVLSIGFALINIFTFLILILFDHLVLRTFPTVPHSAEFNFTILSFRTASKAILLARFGLAPMFIIRGEENILTSLKSSLEVTEENPLFLFPVLMITQFLAYMSPLIFGVLNYLLIVSAFYLIHPHEFPRGRIWPLSSESGKKRRFNFV